MVRYGGERSCVFENLRAVAAGEDGMSGNDVCRVVICFLRFHLPVSLKLGRKECRRESLCRVVLSFSTIFLSCDCQTLLTTRKELLLVYNALIAEFKH